MTWSETMVVIATYNEADTIVSILEALQEFSVLVVDDSSPDGTGDIARGYEHVQVLNRPGKQGIASAYLDGFRAALERQPTYIVQMDAGMTHKPEDVPRLLALAEATGSDLVIGSRFFDSELQSYRTLISYGAAFLMRRLGINVHDATSGFRCWRVGQLATLDFSQVQARGFAFQLELLYLTWRAGGKISEMPIEYLLTSSSFNSKMLLEALQVYVRLWRHRLTRYRTPQGAS
jgi:dolichol-phosphate mannosyltransferase